MATTPTNSLTLATVAAAISGHVEGLGGNLTGAVVHRDGIETIVTEEGGYWLVTSSPSGDDAADLADEHPGVVADLLGTVEEIVAAVTTTRDAASRAFTGIHVEVTNPDDPYGAPAYDGPAGDAHTTLTPGTYTATDLDGDRTYTLTVSPRGTAVALA